MSAQHLAKALLVLLGMLWNSHLLFTLLAKSLETKSIHWNLGESFIASRRRGTKSRYLCWHSNLHHNDNAATSIKSLISRENGFCLTKNIIEERYLVHIPFQKACSFKVLYACPINTQKTIDVNLVMFSFYIFQRSLIQSWMLAFISSSAVDIKKSWCHTASNPCEVGFSKVEMLQVFSNMQNCNFGHHSKFFKTSQMLQMKTWCLFKQQSSHSFSPERRKVRHMCWTAVKLWHKCKSHIKVRKYMTCKILYSSVSFLGFISAIKIRDVPSLLLS